MKKSELKSFIKENIIETLSEASPEDVKAQQDLNAELEKTIQLKKDAGLEEKIEDDDDKDAVKGAMKARGKFKKLDLAIKGLKAVETEMRSLARKFSAEKKEDKKQGILNILKKKTAEKKELESLVAKLEKNVV